VNDEQLQVPTTTGRSHTKGLDINIEPVEAIDVAGSAPR
jgi:hypothetical protein